jgi:hypothetical protein
MRYAADGYFPGAVRRLLSRVAWYFGIKWRDPGFDDEPQDARELSGRDLLQGFVVVVVALTLVSVMTRAVGVETWWFQFACAVAAGALLGLVLRFARRRSRDERQKPRSG